MWTKQQNLWVGGASLGRNGGGGLNLEVRGRAGEKASTLSREERKRGRGGGGRQPTVSGGRGLDVHDGSVRGG